MSWIHCSPLFLPLEPLPIMSPTVMRSCNKKGSSKASTSGSSSVASPKGKSTNAPPAIVRSKKAVDTRRASHPLAGTPITMPSHDSMPPPIPISHSLPDELSSTIGATSMSQELPRSTSYQEKSFLTNSASASQEFLINQSYQDGSFDSQMQGSITFTLESQPMSDLSSSQQQGTQH